MKNINIFINTFKIQIINSFSRSMFKYTLIISPILNLIFLYYIFEKSNITNLGGYIVITSSVMSIWSCMCFSSIGDIMREKLNGTLVSIYLSPVNFKLLIFIKILGNTFLAMVTFFVSFFMAKLLFNTKFIIYYPYLFCFALLMTIICFLIISMFFSYLLTISRKTGLYMNLLEIPIIYFCGLAFPVNILPYQIQIISKIFPITYSIKLIRMSLKIEPVNVSFDIIFKLFVTLLLFVCLFVVVSKMFDSKINIQGNLEMY